MRAKDAIKAYLSFGKKDRIGLLSLVSLIGIIYALPYLFSRKREPFPGKEASIFLAAIDTVSAKEKDKHPNDYRMDNSDFRYQPSLSKSFENGELFRFDPNTLSVEGWQRLGLSERTSRTIEKYRSKGGKFYRPEDIQRIWGLPNGFYERVEDYIVITVKESNYPKSRDKAYERSEKKVLIVDINQADTSAFIALPGIGSKLAARIVNFRDKLGGFYSIDQVAETYGLPDSTFQTIKTSLQLSGSVKTINVNTATKDELKAHPYIRWNLANAIVEYRNQHGSFKGLDELKNIAVIDEVTFEKIKHYLSVQ
ncbi:MAG TPA: helix-hairpin-helix domain-containing protein [Flavisolibacter sp.]